MDSEEGKGVDEIRPGTGWQRRRDLSVRGHEDEIEHLIEDEPTGEAHDRSILKKT